MAPGNVVPPPTSMVICANSLSFPHLFRFAYTRQKILIYGPLSDNQFAGIKLIGRLGPGNHFRGVSKGLANAGWFASNHNTLCNGFAKSLL